MKHFIFTQFAFGAAIIGAIAVMMFMLHGLVGAILYFAFVAVCLTLAVWLGNRNPKEDTVDAPSRHIVEWEYMTVTTYANMLYFLDKGWWYAKANFDWDTLAEKVDCTYTLRRPIIRKEATDEW